MSLADEASKALQHATLVLQYIKTNYPDVFQEAMDTVQEEMETKNVSTTNKK